MLFAVRDGDASFAAADNFKLIPVHDDGGTGIHSDSQQLRVRRHDLSGIPLAVPLVDVRVNRRVGKESEPLAILLRDKPAKVFIVDTTADQKGTQNHRSRRSAADDASVPVKRFEFPLCPRPQIGLSEAAWPPSTEPNSARGPNARSELLGIGLLAVVRVQ